MYALAPVPVSFTVPVIAGLAYVPPVTVLPVKVKAVGKDTVTAPVEVTAVTSFAVPLTEAIAPIEAGVIDVLPPRLTEVPLIVMALLVSEALPILLSVFAEPLIDLLVSVCTLSVSTSVLLAGIVVPFNVVVELLVSVVNAPLEAVVEPIAELSIVLPDNAEGMSWLVNDLKPGVALTPEEGPEKTWLAACANHAAVSVPLFVTGEPETVKSTGIANPTDVTVPVPGTEPQTRLVPFQYKIVLALVGAGTKPVVPAAVW